MASTATSCSCITTNLNSAPDPQNINEISTIINTSVGILKTDYRLLAPMQECTAPGMSVSLWFHNPRQDFVAIKSTINTDYLDELESDMEQVIINELSEEQLNHNMHALAVESKFLQHLQSKGVAGVIPPLQIFQDSTGDRCVHLVLPFCDGGNLEDCLKEQPNGCFTEQQTAIVVKSLAETLNRCHSVGVMHRNVMPQNVFLKSVLPVGCTPLKQAKNDEEEVISAASYIHIASVEDTNPRLYEILLGDFGSAAFFNAVQDSFSANESVGTVQYTAPEVVERTGYDQRADIWSLAALMHYLLVGYTPPNYLNNDTYPQSTVTKTVNDGHLSDEACDLLLSMLEKNPNSRISLTQVIQHPWFTQAASADNTQPPLKRQKV